MPAVLSTITGKGTVPAGGTTNQALTKIDGTDYNLQWATISGGSGSPGGSTTQVQFNDAGAFGTDADFTWDKTNNVLGLGTAGKLNLNSTTDAIAYSSASGGVIYFLQQSGVAATMGLRNSGYLEISNNYGYAWSSATDASATAPDTMLSRNAAGVVEINNGTAGTLRDLTLRNLTVSGTITGGAGGGNVSNSGTPAATDVAVWTDATHIQGGTGLTLSSAVLGLAFPSPGQVILALNNTHATSKSCAVSFQAGGVTQYSLWNDPAGTGALNLVIRDAVSSGQPNKLYIDASGTRVPADNYVGWSSVNGNTVAGTADTALSRNAAGVLEINNGTAGTYRDLKARIVNVTSGMQANGIALDLVYGFANTATVTPGTSDFYLIASGITVSAGAWAARGMYHCVFDVAKTAGTGAIVITLRVGTAGTTADAAIQTFTFGAGTSVADTGTFEVCVNWRAVGASAVIAGWCRAQHNLATTGLFNNAAAWTVIGSPSPSASFNSTAATTIGLSFNGSTAFAGGSITAIQATLTQ